MDKNIIQVEIPLSPSQINDYCKANASGDKDIIFEFDLTNCPLTPTHVLGYLSNLKIDFTVVGFNVNFFIEYLRTPFLVGSSNLSRLHANALMWNTQHFLPFETIQGYDELYNSIPDIVIDQHMSLLRSFPLFLIESSDAPGPIKNEIVNQDQNDVDDILPWVGTNIARLIEFDNVILQLISDTLYNFDDQTYYAHYFDDYIYGGDKLIKFFTDNPNNLLISAVNTLLVK